MTEPKKFVWEQATGQEQLHVLHRWLSNTHGYSNAVENGRVACLDDMEKISVAIFNLKDVSVPVKMHILSLIVECMASLRLMEHLSRTVASYRLEAMRRIRMETME